MLQVDGGREGGGGSSLDCQEILQAGSPEDWDGPVVFGRVAQGCGSCTSQSMQTTLREDDTVQAKSKLGARLLSAGN